MRLEWAANSGGGGKEHGPQCFIAIQGMSYAGSDSNLRYKSDSNSDVPVD